MKFVDLNMKPIEVCCNMDGINVKFNYPIIHQMIEDGDVRWGWRVRVGAGQNGLREGEGTV